MDIGFLSVDQEKAFDRVDHYLFKILEAFGLGPHFVSFIKFMYSNVTRGIRQGCPLSGLLYAISIEPLLRLLGKDYVVLVFLIVLKFHT